MVRWITPVRIAASFHTVTVFLLLSSPRQPHSLSHNCLLTSTCSVKPTHTFMTTQLSKMNAVCGVSGILPHENTGRNSHTQRLWWGRAHGNVNTCVRCPMASRPKDTQRLGKSFRFRSLKSWEEKRSNQEPNRIWCHSLRGWHHTWQVHHMFTKQLRQEIAAGLQQTCTDYHAPFLADPSGRCSHMTRWWFISTRFYDPPPPKVKVRLFDSCVSKITWTTAQIW